MKSSNSSAMLIVWSIGAIVAAIIAIGVFPPLFGGLALFFGYLASRYHRGLGVALMIMAAISLIVGVILGAMWGMENLRF